MTRYGRTLLLLAVLLLCAALLGANAFAAEPVAEGSCGDAATWTLDGDGVLTISGTGQLKTWSSSSAAPWKDHLEAIRTLVVEEGITKLNRRSFSDLPNLETAALPSSLTSMDEQTFFSCPGLRAINVAEGCANYASRDGVLFKLVRSGSSWMLSLFRYPYGREGAYTVTEEVGRVEANAIQNCEGLTELTIASPRTSLNSVCVSGCPALKKIAYGDEVQYASLYFRDCPALESATMPWMLLGVNSTAFQQTPSVKEAFFRNAPPPNVSDSAIPTVFAGGKDVVLRVPMEHLEAWQATAWAEAYTVEGYDLPPETVLSGTWGDGTEQSALLSWTVTTDGSMTVSGEGPMKGGFGRVGWAGVAPFVRKLTLEEGVTTVGNRCFEKFTALKEISLPETVTELLYGAFQNCTALNEVELPNGVKTLAGLSFSGCTALQRIRIGYRTKELENGCLPTAAEAPEMTVEVWERSRAQLYVIENELPCLSLGASPVKEIRVTTSNELLSALGDNPLDRDAVLEDHTRIVLADGEYHVPENIRLRDCVDVTLAAEHPGKAEVLGGDGLMPVISAQPQVIVSNKGPVAFIRVEGLILGHEQTFEQGGCSGVSEAYVIYGAKVRELEVVGCDLWGCGTVAVYLTRSMAVRVEDSLLRDCTLNAVTVADSELTVKNCIVSGNEYTGNYPTYPCVSVSGETALLFTGCTFFNNYSTCLLNEAAAEREEEFFKDCVFFDNGWQGKTPGSYGVCLGGATWQVVKNAGGWNELVLWQAVKDEAGNVLLPGCEAAVPEYSSVSAPWKRYGVSYVPDKPGDVNGDGKVDTADAAAIFAAVSAGDGALPLKTGDMNGDGKINNRDALLLFRRAAGTA